MSPVLITGLRLLFALMNLADFLGQDAESWGAASPSTCNFWVSSPRILVVFFFSFSCKLTPKCLSSPKRVPPEPSLYPCLFLVQPLPSSLHGSHLCILFSWLLSLAAWLHVPMPAGKELLIPKSHPSPLWKCPSVHLKLGLRAKQAVLAVLYCSVPLHSEIP